MNNWLTISNDKAYSKADIYRTIFRILFFICICYTFHRYLLKYGHSDFLQRDYRPTPIIWQAGKFVLITLLMGLIYSMSTFESRIRRSLLIAYVILIVALIINLLSSLIYGEVLGDEFEYQILAITLLPLAVVKKADLEFLKDEISGPLLNTTQWILIVTNAYVVANYLIADRLPFHAYVGVIIRFGGLWDDPNAMAIFSVFLLVYAFRRKQYVAAGLHIVNIGLTLSFTGFILLALTGLYLGYRRIRPVLLYPTLIAVGLLAACIAYIFQDAILQLYEVKRESVDLHTSFDKSYYPIPLLQKMAFHETWWISALYNYTPFSIPVLLFMFWYFAKAFFVYPESLQRFYFILFVATSIFLPFIYMFPLNFILVLFTVLYMKGIQF